MDIFEKCTEYTYAKEVMATGLYPYFIAMSGNEGSEAICRGKRLIMCGSNNYLGLTTHPKVRQAAIDAIAKYGTSCTGSRFLNGTLEMHEQLEHELAEWVGKQAALVFSTGMQVNLGTISSLVGRKDVVLLDRDDHASIVDGARLGWGHVRRFRHNDIADLERLLKEIPDDVGKLVVVDGLFSMAAQVIHFDHQAVLFSVGLYCRAEAELVLGAQLVDRPSNRHKCCLQRLLVGRVDPQELRLPVGQLSQRLHISFLCARPGDRVKDHLLAHGFIDCLLEGVLTQL